MLATKEFYKVQLPNKKSSLSLTHNRDELNVKTKEKHLD